MQRDLRWLLSERCPLRLLSLQCEVAIHDPADKMSPHCPWIFLEQPRCSRPPRGRLYRMHLLSKDVDPEQVDDSTQTYSKWDLVGISSLIDITEHFPKVAMIRFDQLFRKADRRHVSHCIAMSKYFIEEVATQSRAFFRRAVENLSFVSKKPQVVGAGFCKVQQLR